MARRGRRGMARTGLAREAWQARLGVARYGRQSLRSEKMTKLVTKTLLSSLVIAGLPSMGGLIKVFGVGATKEDALNKARAILIEQQDRRAVEHACKALKSEWKSGKKKAS